MMQHILDIFYFIGIYFVFISASICLYTILHFVIFGGKVGVEYNKETKEWELKLTLNNYNKHFNDESIR